MNEARGLVERIESLLDRTAFIERQARHIQADRPSTWTDDQTREFRAQYQDWYGSALLCLPDDLRAEFTKEYNDGRMIKRIAGFVSNPTRPSALFARAALENPESDSFSYWQHPVQMTFLDHFHKQQAILRQAKGRYTLHSTIPDQPVFGLQDNNSKLDTSPGQSQGGVINLVGDRIEPQGGPVVFVAHGGSSVYLEILRFLKDDLLIDARAFETNNHTSEQISSILQQYLITSTAAIIVMTGDEKIGKRLLPRLNVVHEADLFQAELGFDRVALLKQSGVEDFSNIRGLHYIPFHIENVKGFFYDLRGFLHKIGLVSR